MLYSLKNKQVVLNVIEEKDILEIQGEVINAKKYSYMELFAPSPIDRMMNYSGSGLPFPCPFVAFENTPNKFIIPANGTIKCTFKKPNSYYTEDTQEKVPPSVFVKLVENNTPVFIHFPLEDHLPLKTLYYRPERTGPDFYQRKADVIGVKSQETIIRMLEEVKVKAKCA
jgi:hypothetical protein